MEDTHYINNTERGQIPNLHIPGLKKNLLVLWANSSLIFLARGLFLPAPQTELNNNNNNNGLLTDPLGGSSLLKYINYN